MNFPGSDNGPALDQYFAGHPVSRALFDVLHEVIGEMAGVRVRVTKSQIAFRHRRAFAWAWMPGIALRRPAAPLVLSFSLRSKLSAPRLKEVVEPYPGRFMHHLELTSASQIDDEVRQWLWRAWDEAR
jgi:hypothetical protein